VSDIAFLDASSSCYAAIFDDLDSFSLAKQNQQIAFDVRCRCMIQGSSYLDSVGEVRGLMAEDSRVRNR
jgi:hypothetical protein